MMDITLRTAMMSDLKDIAAIEAICFPAAEAASYSSLQDRISAFGASFVVALYEGSIIGFINGCVTNQQTITDDLFLSTKKHDTKGQYQAIFGLDVLPKLQHQHVAGKLMREFIHRAQVQGRKGLILTCKNRLIPMYEHLGYTNRGLSGSTHGNATWYDMDLLF